MLSRFANSRSWPVENRLGLVVDDGKYQGLLVREVVVQLRTAHVGSCLDAVEACSGDPSVVHDRGGGGHDAVARRLALARQVYGGRCRVGGHAENLAFWT